MHTNYLKSAFRNLRRNTGYSLINIGGLAAGMAVALIIGLWIRDEFSFNHYHRNYDRLAQVIQNVTNNGEVQTWFSVPFPLADELRSNYGSDFESVVMASGTYPHVLAWEDKLLTRSGTFFEPGGPELLSLQLQEGSTDLKDPGTILLSASTAKAVFGDTDPMHKTIRVDDQMTVQVTGIYEDVPRNSAFSDLGFIMPWQLYYDNSGWVKTASDPWRPNAFSLFVKLTENADPGQVSARIKDAKLKHMSTELAKKKPALFLLPMSRWHLYSEYRDGINTGGRIRYVRMFGIIGVFVLFMACINFMNLSTARSEKRAKEVGVRKAIGSGRRQLIGQFLGESLFFAGLSFAVSLLLVQGLLPFFNNISDKAMTLPWKEPVFWGVGLAFILVTGLIAGSYPAFYLSSFRPVKVLAGPFKAGRWAALPRKVLIVLQFTVSVSLIIGTMIVFSQIKFAQNRPLGYNADGLVAIPVVNGEIHKHFDVFKAALMDEKAVIAVAETTNPTTETWSTSSGFDWRGKDPNLSVDFPNVGVSLGYGETIGWKFLEGRDFSADFPTDSTGFILNEAAARYMNLENPIGETIKWFGTPCHVIGVVEDMVMGSPYQPVKPTIFYLDESPGNFVVAKLNPEAGAPASLDKIERIFRKYSPAQPFEYSFADEEFSKKFNTEKRVGKLASFFAVLAVFISCLGLFGLASFVAEQRTREIGIRKVLGASIFNIWKLLSEDFVVLVIIACVAAAPLAWYFLNGWLENFSYRTRISGWIFAAAGLGALAITLLTVSFQSIRAALANPVKSLRSE